ncbi:unnamed protein product, partial [marine sediment metagenome]
NAEDLKYAEEFAQNLKQNLQKEMKAKSKAYYLKKRAEGKAHNHTLRCLARQLIKVIYKMLTEDRDYIIRKELRKVA